MAPPKVINIFNYSKSHAKPRPKVPDAVWQRLLYFIAFGFGSGAMPFAPGTFGTLMAIPFYLILRPLPLFMHLILIFCFTLFSMWLCDRISKDIHIHDHPGMCIDEFIGYFFTMIAAPQGGIWIILGFVLFRFFDICKPWPIDWVDEKIHGGIGMILDDIVAGIFASIILHILAMLL